MQEQTIHWRGPSLTRVPYDLYTDPATSQREQERIYRGATWNYLCLEAELPEAGSYRTTHVGDTPVVRLNRAVAVAEVSGPAAGLALLDGLELPGFHLLPATRADLLRRLGRTAEAESLRSRALQLYPGEPLLTGSAARSVATTLERKPSS